MRIAFIHADGSFLPEIKAYQRFFTNMNIETTTAGFREAEKKIDADVLWFIMGFSTHARKGTLTIHEYTSASTPPFSLVKDAAKRIFNSRPDYRIFLNVYVKQKLDFQDRIRFGYRDMGIDLSIFHPATGTKKEYDFIYVGNLHHTRRLESLLTCFETGKLRDRNLFILSRDYESYAKKYSASRNIQFAGPVPANEVADYLNRSAFAINYIPDEEPYNQQTSTKLLEYAACQVPIISTSYSWIKQFQQQYGGRYFFPGKDLSNFNWESVNDFDYAFPDLSGWEWEKQIVRSGVVDFILEKFPGV